jgi:hypothetical protein
MDQKRQRELAKFEIAGTALRVFGRLLAFLSARTRASISNEHSWQSGQNEI